MFTGIVEATGRIKARSARAPGARLRIATVVGPLQVGESIAVQGVCLTVEALESGGFQCSATGETLERSTLGELPVGARVHLERSLPLAGRLGGHIVTGHVDGKLRLHSRSPMGEAVKLVFEILDAELARFVAAKGSVAVDGVSLTVNGVSSSMFDVVIIPHTLAVTTLGDLVPGQEANLEVDILARYVARLLVADSDGDLPNTQPAPEETLLAKLKRGGFF
jgi:riboflavin synthase